MVNYIVYEWDLAEKDTHLNHDYLEFRITSGSEKKNIRYFNLVLYTGEGGQEYVSLAEEMSLSHLVQLRDFLNGIKFTEREETEGIK